MKKHKQPKKRVIFHPILFAILLLLAIGIGVWFLKSFNHDMHANAQTTTIPTTNDVAGLHVQGNQLLNGNGQQVVLRGVNRSGTEYACVQGWGIFDGPNDFTSIQAIKGWNTNAVRVPLNEDCWLGINGVSPIYSGVNYQQAIINYVNLLTQNGLAAIVELHWSAPGTQQATGQQPMPDADHAPAFWQSVADTFKGNSSVVFDLFNEPYPDSNQDSTAAWTCLRDGGTCSGVSFQVAGMQNLVDSVRSTGATNVIMVPGVQYTNTLTQWLSYKPNDTLNNIAASWHSYNFNICTTSTCWDSQIAPVNAQVPLIIGELGENDCAHSYIDTLLNWADTQNASYLGWTWDTWDCSNGPALISNYDGTPTNYGVGYKTHLAALSPLVTPVDTATPAPSPLPTATIAPSATPVPDTTAPVVSISSPANNATVRGMVGISASATDNVGVTRMELYIDGTQRKMVYSSSINMNWNTRKETTGSHTIVVRAYDAAANVGLATVTVTVSR